MSGFFNRFLLPLMMTNPAASHVQRPQSATQSAASACVCAPQQISIREGELGVTHAEETSSTRCQGPTDMAGPPTGCTREEARRLLHEAGMQPPLLAKPLWADGRDGAHGLAVIHEVLRHAPVHAALSTGRHLHECLADVPGGGGSPLRCSQCAAVFALQMEGVEQLVSGEGPSGFGLPAMLQQYVEHGGCLFKVRASSTSCRLRTCIRAARRCRSCSGARLWQTPPISDGVLSST